MSRFSRMFVLYFVLYNATVTNAKRKFTNKEIMAYMVSVRFGSVITYYEHHCSGTLLSNKYVVTAAHCVTDSKPVHLWVITGITKTADSLPDYAQIHPVQEVKVHPNYPKYETITDLAVLKTKTIMHEDMGGIFIPKLINREPLKVTPCVAVNWLSTGAKSAYVLVIVSQKMNVNCTFGGRICTQNAKNSTKSKQRDDSSGSLLCHGHITGIQTRIQDNNTFKYYVDLYKARDWIYNNTDLSYAMNFGISRLTFILSTYLLLIVT